MRAADRWLAGLVLFLIAIVCVACTIGWTAISRQSRATCYQLTAIEQTERRELKLVTGDPGNAETHRKSAANSAAYAAGLRAIVPGCPPPPRAR